MFGRSSDEAVSEPAVSNTDAHGGRGSKKGTVVERVSRYGMQVMPMPVPGGFQRRTRLQRQQEVCDSAAPERESITPAMRKKYLKELLLGNSSNSGFSSVLSSQSYTRSGEEDTDWALYPMEHAWMLSAVEGSYEIIMDFISEDPQLLTRRDFISGYSVLHWLAKRGQDETLIKLWRYAQSEGIPVNVNLKGSGGLTPLHLASMHSQYMVIKLLVGAFNANVDAMDYNGKRPWQYLRENAPPEMKELLGAWDEEHSWGCTQNVNKNGNNNCAGAVNLTACEEDDVVEAEEVKHFDRTKRRSGWSLGSLKKLLPSFPPLLGSKT